MSYLNQQDDFLKKNLQNLRAEPDSDLWANISARLDDMPFPAQDDPSEIKNEIIDSNKLRIAGRSHLRWYVAASIVFILVSSVILFSRKPSDTKDNTTLALAENPSTQIILGKNQTNITPQNVGTNAITNSVVKSGSNSSSQSSINSNDDKVIEEAKKESDNGLLLAETQNKPFKGVILNIYNMNKPSGHAVPVFKTTSPRIITTIREDEQALVDASQLDPGKVNNASYFYQVGLKLFWQGNYCKSHLHLSKAKGLLCNRDKIHDEVDEVIRLVENKINEDCICMVDEDPFIQN